MHWRSRHIQITLALWNRILLSILSAMRAAMSFLSALVRSHLEALRFLRALPLLGLLIMAAETLQHLAELSLGMYVSKAEFHRLSGDPGRMTPGLLKVTFLLGIAYFVYRFVISGGSAKVASRLDPVALGRFSVIVALQLAIAALTFGGPPALSHLGLSANISSLLIAALGLVTLPIGVALTAWQVSAALGGEKLTMAESFRRSPGSFWWTLGLTLLAPAPLMAAHFGLSRAALGRPMGALVILLSLDVIVVGLLGVVTNTAPALCAQRMAERAGKALVCAD
jgi:hypothetical protein